MRSAAMVAALLMVAGCKSATAPGVAPRETVSGHSVSPWPAWLYEGHDMDPPGFPRLLGLSALQVGDSLEIRTTFEADPPAGYGDGWRARGTLLDVRLAPEGHWAYDQAAPLVGSVTLTGRQLAIRGPASALTFTPDAAEVLLEHDVLGGHGYGTYLGRVKWFGAGVLAGR